MAHPRRGRPTLGMNGGDRPLGWQWADKCLTGQRNYWLVTARDDAFPQARPLWGVWSDGLLYLSVGHAGVQRARKRDDGKIDVTVHGDSAVDVVIVEGAMERASRATKAKTVAGELYEAKYGYSADFINFVVRPRFVYGWRDEDVKTATKWMFD